MKILIYSAWLGVILLMAATIGLIKMNWSEKLYTPLLSLFIVGILSTFVTVFVMLKETKKEDEFLTYIVINEKQHLPPNIFQGRSTKLKERLMELSYLGRPTTRDDSISSLSIEQPKNVTETFTYGCELLQYKIIIDLCEMQLYGPTLYSTFDGGVRTSIQTKYRTTDMEKISGPEVLKIVSTN